MAETSVDKGQAARGIEMRGTLSWVWTLLGPFLGLVLIVVLFGTITRDSGTFLTADNWRTIAVQTVIVATAALGMTIIMIAGGIDLSVGSTVSAARHRWYRDVRQKGRPTIIGFDPRLEARLTVSPVAGNCDRRVVRIMINQAH